MPNTRLFAVALFSVMAVFQTVRFVRAWPVTIGTFSVPVWASAVAAIAFAALAMLFWRDRR